MKRIATGILLPILVAGIGGRAQSPAICEIPAASLQSSPDSLQETAMATITGALNDERGNPVVNAFVECAGGGVIQGGELTDFDGAYPIRSLSAGRPDVAFKFQGNESIVRDVSLAAGMQQIVNGTLNSGSTGCLTPHIIPSSPSTTFPLIDPKHPGGRTIHAGATHW